MTPLKQQISLIPFSIEHPYKRRRFENRSDQTFCILLIKDVLSVIESANLRPCKNLKQKWSGFEFGLIWIWMSVKYPFQNCGSVPKLCIHSSASFISPSLVDIGCWLYENWENREMLTNVPSCVSKRKTDKFISRFNCAENTFFANFIARCNVSIEYFIFSS